MPSTTIEPSRVDSHLGERAHPLRDHPLARVARGKLRHGREARGGDAARAPPPRPRRCAAGCRCPSRRRARAPALGGPTSWSRTIRTRATCPRSGAARTRTEFVLSQRRAARPVCLWVLRVAWITLPLTAGAAVSAAIERLGRRATRRRGSVAVARVGDRAARRARAAAARRSPRCASSRPAFVVRRDPRRDRRRRVDRGVHRRARRDHRRARARVRARHRVAAANAVAYGDEQRFPLRTPPALFLGPLPVAAPRSSPPRSSPRPAPRRRASGSLGVVILVLGRPRRRRAQPGAARLCRAAGRCSCPAGFVVVDPLTLADPVLFLREHVRGAAARGRRPPRPPTCSTSGSAPRRAASAVRFDEPVELQRSAPRAARRGGNGARRPTIRFAVARRDEMLALASARRIRGA